MNRDEFFTKVDAKLHKKTGANTSIETESQNRELVKQVISRLMPVVVSYRSKLQERGINADVDSSPAGISITLRYKDGDHNELQIGSISKSSILELKTSLVESGQAYVTTKTYDYDKWNDSIFETKLQKLIDNFLLYADKHGGI